MNSLRLAEGSEFDRIRGIWRRLGDRARGGGDDCAYFRTGDQRMAVSTDLSLEGVHFRTGWMRPDEIGRRAASAALSDLAAVAATPMGILVSLALSEELPEDYACELLDGAGDAAAATGAAVWGGDLARNTQLTIDVTVIGRLDANPVARDGAEDGDGLFVTGELGGAAAALAAWEAGHEPQSGARDRFVAPTARVWEAQWLRDRGATSMIDISDGLAADAAHLAAASRKTCAIDGEDVPVHPAATDWRQAVGSGEEYELLVTLPPWRSKNVTEEFLDAFGIPLTQIGRVTEGTGVRLLEHGTVVEGGEGYGHF